MVILKDDYNYLVKITNRRPNMAPDNVIYSTECEWYIWDKSQINKEELRDIFGVYNRDRYIYYII